MDITRSIKSLLEKHPIIGIDTVAFIYHLEENHMYLPFTNVLFEMVENGIIKGVTSVITVMEILVKPKKERNEQAIQEYKFILQTFPNLKIKPIDFHTAEKAAELRAKYGIKPPNAIHLAAALTERANAFVTNDEKLKQVEEIETIVMKRALGIQ
ncbi:MAG: type II toxin-antitoxin system VapC family toxin [Candidatus Bathyarchaeia archaeon]